MKRKVQSFSVQLVGKDLHVDIQTDRKKPHSYRIWADVRHPDIAAVEKHLQAGLSQVVQLSSKIEISEYFERSYVFIDLPIDYHCNQYSAQER